MPLLTRCSRTLAGGLSGQGSIRKGPLQPISAQQCPHAGGQQEGPLCEVWPQSRLALLVASPLSAQGQQESRPLSSICDTCRGLELSHLLVGVGLPLFPLQARLLGPELPQLPLGSCQLLLQLGGCHTVPREGPTFSSGLPPAPPQTRTTAPELSQGNLGRGEVPGAGPHIPASVAGKGLLDAADGSLGLLNLLLSLEKPQAQGPFGTPAGVVHLLAAPPGGRCPHLWGPWSPTFQLLIQEVEHTARRWAAPGSTPSAPALWGLADASLATPGSLLQDLCTLVQRLPARQHHSMDRLHPALCMPAQT